MSGRFTSGGTIGGDGDVSKDDGAGGASSSSSNAVGTKAPVDNAKLRQWEAVQQELDAERRRREEHRVKTATGEGEKSLYDILQANKAAKQAAFEEQSKLRNQFRALDDDEIEFLDDVRAAKRAEEERVRRETEEGLKAFRERQKGGDGTSGVAEATAGAATAAAGDGAAGGDHQAEDESWGVGRKRKRVKDREVKGVGVRRRVSGGEADKDALPKAAAAAAAAAAEDRKAQDSQAKKPSETAAEKPPEKKPSLGLVAYGSDSDDD